MTIDEVIVDSLSKTTHRSTLVAAYAVRRNADFFGYVEARLNPHGSPHPQDWETTWIAYWQLADGRLSTASSDDLHELLKEFGEINLMPAMLGAPVEFVQRCRQENPQGGAGAANTDSSNKSWNPLSGLLARLRGKRD